MADAADKERQLAEMQESYERQLEDVEQDLNTSRGIASDLQAQWVLDPVSWKCPKLGLS